MTKLSDETMSVLEKFLGGKEKQKSSIVETVLADIDLEPAGSSISYKKGDLTKAVESVIAHGCNCQGVMGAGVAKAIRSKFPKAYKSYKEVCDRVGNNLHGKVQIVKVAKDKYVANVFSQVYYGSRHHCFDYEKFKQAMVSLAEKSLGLGFRKIALPRIGAGLGKGSWDKIQKVLVQVAKDKGVSFVVYTLGTPRKEVKAISYQKPMITDLSDAALYPNKVKKAIRTNRVCILITKDPGRLYKNIKGLELDNVLVQVSITGLGGTKWEPNVPSPKEAFKAVGKLCDLLDGRVSLRYDPIIPGVNDDNKWFEQFIAKAAQYNINGITCSVVDMYKHARKRIIERGLKVPFDGFHYKGRKDIIKRFIGIANKHGVDVRVCCEQGFAHKQSQGCDWVDTIAPKEVLNTGQQRKNCSCPDMEQILSYSDKCSHDCAYCYRKY